MQQSPVEGGSGLSSIALISTKHDILRGQQENEKLCLWNLVSLLYKDFQNDFYISYLIFVFMISLFQKIYKNIFVKIFK